MSLEPPAGSPAPPPSGPSVAPGRLAQLLPDGPWPVGDDAAAGRQRRPSVDTEVADSLGDLPIVVDLADQRLLAVAHSAFAQGSIPDLIDRVVAAAGEALGCRCGIVWLARPQGLQPVGWWGPVMALQQHGPAHAAELTASERKAVVVRSAEWNPDISETEAQETLSVPFPPSGPSSGVLTLTRGATAEGFVPEQQTIALIAASLLGVAMRPPPRGDSNDTGSFHTQRLEVLGRLASSAAHDLNNLLMAIDGYAQMLEDETPPEGSEAGDIRAIRQATSRSIELVKAVLGFSRAESGEAETIDANRVVRGIERLLDQVAGEDVELLRTLSPEPLPTRIHSIQLEQVLVNLVANARDASAPGGSIEIATSKAPRGPGLPVEGYVRITVRDAGTGISDEVKQRIFDPFFTTKPTARGTGLGLATVNEIVGRAGGSIHVDSQPAEGTTFTVLLPAVPSSGH